MMRSNGSTPRGDVFLPRFQRAGKARGQAKILFTLLEQIEAKPPQLAVQPADRLL
jgi:hypothetical protein